MTFPGLTPASIDGPISGLPESDHQPMILSVPPPDNLPRRLAWLLLCGLLLALQPARAEQNQPDPRSVLITSSRHVIEQLNARQAEIRANPEVVNRLVEEYLLPHVDFVAASRWVLGKHWRRASREQKLEFIRQFRNLLLRFYSSGLAEYMKSHQIDPAMFEFLPLRAQPDAKRVTVSMKVHTPGGKIVPVKYRMHLTRNGWKIYDISVEGVSLATTYRTSFSGIIRQHGLDGLIADLTEKNARLMAGNPVGIN